MKRNIIINSSRTALIITDHLHSGVGLVSLDTAINEEIFIFDTYLDLCCCLKKTTNSYKVVEEFIPLKKFRSFAKCISDKPSEIYKALIQSLIKL